MSEEQRTQLLDDLILGDRPVADRAMITLDLPDTPTSEILITNDQKEGIVTALLDSGATANFLDRKVLERLELPT